MKFQISCILSLILLFANIAPVFAEAPTSPKILFTSARDGNRDVYIMNPDGSGQVNLTQHPADDLQAVWSPIGDQILFISDRGHKVWGTWDLYLMDPDGSNVRRVFKKEDFRNSPTWSPDGKQIAYKNSNWDAGESHIYIATLGEQEEEHIVEGLAPAWSPNGRELAYVAYILTARRVTLIDIRTRKQERLLPRKANPSQNGPSWSAAGDKLAFSWNTHKVPPIEAGRAVWNAWETTKTIYIVNRDGTGLQQLVDEAGPYAQYPALSPDGSEVLYTQAINGRQQIFKLDMNSGTTAQLTHVGHLYQANTGGDWFDPAYALPVSPQPNSLTTVWGQVKIRD